MKRGELMNSGTRTHKATGWTRTPLGWGKWQIVPTDGSGDRVVDFVSRGSWGNLPNDRREDQHKDRIVLVSGEPLPDWAIAWLTAANAKSCASGRAALQAAIDDADWHADSRDGW
jgi:hypothetical protein